MEERILDRMPQIGRRDGLGAFPHTAFARLPHRHRHEVSSEMKSPGHQNMRAHKVEESW